ncbi:unnamed protein product [Acanthoscelides obtectus]|uniref:Nucleoprotein TPR n=1 Tax=Acanthoscelides obtectus TaxID=200917 RepID=A0A9P0KBJ0_ACAOB|nr:unnamed protein product [Acanthoscelides obtectus]CAK1622806.1 Nucleoprotein TPR [Acanthoscelides obtectus]
MEGAFIFTPVVTKDEWETVNAEIRTKVEGFVKEKFEEFITAKALLETKCFNAEQTIAELRASNERLQSESDTLKAKLEVAAKTVEEHEVQLANLTSEINRLRQQCNTLEAETAEYRHQRNLAVDEKDEHLKMMQRRDAEIERWQTEMATLTKQLESAVNAKCEALAQADEVASMKITIEYREKRLEQERALLNNQMESLTEELNQRTEELLNIRRDNTVRCIQLETKLSEKTQELAVSAEHIKSLTELNNNLVTRNEELTQKMENQREVDAKMNESYIYEIDAKTKMANAYKAMYEESNKHAEEIKEALTEVQQLLRTATEQYGDLETKHKESELMHEEILAKKNECIEVLKKELETANDVIKGLKSNDARADLEGLASAAAAAMKLPKPGLTFSEVYAKYVSTHEKLIDKDEECARLNNYISCIVKEIEEKGPLIKKLRQDYSDTLDANEELTQANDQLTMEVQQLREAMAECKRLEGVTARENERLKKDVADLSRQVVHLLQEVEHSRAGSSSTSTDNETNDSVSSADIITKKLVTFNDIAELQDTNRKLLALVRELTERQEEAELIDPASIANLKSKLEELRASQEELLEERERQNKMMATLRSQRDMYKNLYSQVQRSSGEEMPLDRPFEKEGNDTQIQSEPETQLTNKVKELQDTIEKLNKKIDMLKEENDTYRKEKTANEKILLEQLETLRAEAKELTRLNGKLVSHADVNEEKFKIMKNNVEIYKKQIVALEKQNKIYSEAIIKHEQAATYLKDETLQSQAKLSKAEVMLSNLQKENALLRDAEQRLLKERESLKRDQHQQNLIKSNMELIKATLERTDAESRIRLETRLDEAHRECAALRRRLQEDQDHFRQLSEHLQKQTKDAQDRAEEERSQAEKLRKELSEARDELIQKTKQMEELSKKLKMGIFTVPDTSAEVKKIRELEEQLTNSESQINSLNVKLKASKEATEEYMNLAQASEKQAKDIFEQNETLQQTIEKQKETIKQLQEKCQELEGELSIQLDDEDIKNAGLKNKSSQLQEELNIKTMDLNTAKQQLEAARTESRTLVEQLKAVENKYAREVTLHSVDLQSLSNMKEQLETALGNINDLDAEKANAVAALNEHLKAEEERDKIFRKEKEELETRFKDMDAQNALLLDQIQALNTQLSILQAQASETPTPNTSIADQSMNRSLTEDDVKSSEQLLKIIKYLRQEKDIAISKAEIMEAEHIRLKSQFDVITKQYEEAKAAVEVERQKQEVSVVSTSKHAEVLRKLETLNAITDSNRTLRSERDELLSQITEYRERAERLEIEVAPLQEKNRDLSTKADQMQAENISLRAECTRWRQRANMLIEKTNRTSPEDWKKLQTERETLAKQLTIERATTTKLNDEINTLKQDKSKLEEQLKSVRAQNNQQAEELAKLREEVTGLQQQVNQLQNTIDQQSAELLKLKEENRVLTEDTAAKDVTLTELKNNLAQIRKIAKKYKIQCEEQTKEIEALNKQKAESESQQSSNAERQEQVLNEQRTELEQRITQLENAHKEAVAKLNEQIAANMEQIESYKKEIEALKQSSMDKEDRFKNLFKNAKERIVSLQEQNSSLKEELTKQDRGGGGDQSSEGSSSKNAELLEKIAELERERDELIDERQQEKEKFLTECENLNQRLTQLQRQLDKQQGSKPSTSSASSDKSATERPTADIKPMAGHSTNTQTQSARIQPWCSGGEPPLASIRPMSAQLRTVAVLPTSQSPSAVMVPPQQQVHTTGGSSTIESLSSSPTSSHTDYAPATSSASSSGASANPLAGSSVGGAAGSSGRQAAAVPPTQSSQDAGEDDEATAATAAGTTGSGNGSAAQAATSAVGGSTQGHTVATGAQGQSQTTLQQQQAVALVMPRVEVPSSAPTQEQGTSSSSSNTVTTSQAGHKRQREPDDSCQAEEQGKTQQSKRTRIQQSGTVSDSGLEVEYQVPTSSQRDHDDYNVIVVESDDDEEVEEGAADEGDGDAGEDPDTEGYDMEGMEQDNYEDADCQDVEDEEGGNEVEVIEDSSEVPNQSEGSVQEGRGEEGSEQPQSEAISSGTDGPAFIVTISQASPSVPSTNSVSRTAARQVAPLSRHHLFDEGGQCSGDDGIVPSTPTLFVPRRSDGYGEAVSSPHVPNAPPAARFTFGEPPAVIQPLPAVAVAEQALDDDSTGRSVPTTPLQSSPQESIPVGGASGTGEEQQEEEPSHADAELPTVDIDDNETGGEGSSMGPPTMAGLSEGSQQLDQGEEMLEGDDGLNCLFTFHPSSKSM